MPKYKIGSRILDVQEDKVDEFLTTAQSIGDNPILIEETKEAGKIPPQVPGAPVEETTAPDMVSALEPTSLELSKTKKEDKPSILESLAARTARGFVTAAKGITETKDAIVFGATQIFNPDMTTDEKQALYDVIRSGDVFNIAGVPNIPSKDLASVENWLTESVRKTDNETITEAISKGNIAEAAELTVGGALESIPSLLAAFTGYGGLAMLGTSVAGNKFEQEFEKDPEKQTSILALNAIGTGVTEAGFELITRGILKKANLLPGGAKQAAELIDQSAKTIVKKIGLSVLGEGASEAATQITSIIVDEATLVEGEKDFSGTVGKRIAEVIDAGIVGGFVGGTLSTVGAIGGTTEPARQRAETVLAPLEAKAKMDFLAKEMSRLQSDLNKDETEEGREIIKNKIEDIEKIARSVKIQNSANLSVLQGENLKQYASNTDQINKTQKILASNRSSQSAKDIAKAKIEDLSNKNNEIIRSAKKEYLEKETEFVKQVSPEFLNIDVVETKQDFEQKYGKDKADADGVIIDNNIAINKEVASETGAITVSSHELLHAILGKTFRVSDPTNTQEVQRVEKLVNDFKDVLSQNDVLEPVESRIEQNYKFDENGNERPLYEYAEEYITSFSDAVGKGEIRIKENVFEKTKNLFQRLFKKYDYNKEFETGQDLFDLVKTYRKDVKARRKDDISKIIAFDERQTLRPSKTQQELNDRVDKLVGDKDAQGNYKYTSKAEFQSSENFINAYNQIIEGNILVPLITRGIEGNSVYGKPIEDFIQEVKDGLAEVLIRFDPTQNNSLIGFINAQLRFRKGDILNKYKKQSAEQSIDVEVGEVGSLRELAVEEQEFELTTERDIEEQDAGIKPADLLKNNGHSDLVEKLSSDIEKLDVENLTFKTIPNMAAEVVSEATGITVSKILDPKKNLSTGEARSAQEFIYKNIDAILKLLPQGAVTEAASETLLGTSTGMPKNLLKNFYEKDPVRRTEAQGLYEFKKLDNIDKDTALAFFGIMPDGSAMPGFSGRTPESQTIKALSNVLGKLATNSAVRDLLKQQGFNPNVVQNIAAGKSPAMFSKTIKTKRAENLVDMLSVLDNNANIDDVRNLLLRAGLSNIEIEDFIQGYEKYLNNNKEKNVNKSTAESIQDYLNNKDVFELLNESEQLKDVVAGYGVDLVVNKNGVRNKYGDQVLNTLYVPFFNELTNSGKDVNAVSLFFKVLSRPFSHGGSYSLFDGNKQIVDYFNNVISKDSEVKLGISGRSLVLLNKKSGDVVSSFTRTRYDSQKGVKEAHNSNDFSITEKVYGEQAIIARKDLELFITKLNDFITKSEVDKKQFKGVIVRAVNSLLKPSDGLLRLAAKPTVFLKQEGSFENSTYEFEHRPPISLFGRYLISSLYNGDVDIQEVLKGLNNLEGGFVPKKVHDDINKTHKSTMQKGYRFGDNAWKLYDLKGESVQKISEAKFSKTTTDNVQLEEKMAGIISSVDPRITPSQQLDLATARNLAATRRKRRDIIAPSADDFDGLIYRFLGKGKLGEEQYQFFKDNLYKPYGEAYYKLNLTRQRVSDQFKNINKQNKSLVKKLKQDSGFGGYTFEQALRVWLFQKAGYTPSGLNEDTIEVLTKIVKNNPDIEAYGQSISSILPITEFWVEPDANNWQIDTIKTDVIDAIEKVTRKQFLDEWKTNVDQIFSKNNMNKITAAFGEDFTDALKDILYRMETGSSRPEGADKQMNAFMNWVRGSVAVTMFFNTRSAILQQISLVNFINWGDNNPLKAAAAVADVNQYSKDFAFIFNSEYLKQRRGGLKTDVNAADLAEAIKKGGYKGALAQLLQAGFSLTQLGDSFAISTGGASFYRNRINTYKSQGMSIEAAEKQAFLDFQELSEEAQQSARPDRLSKQQTNNIGRVFLAFQNTPMQMTRLMVKAAKDLKAGRGDAKTNISKIVYYGFIQSVIFSAFQTALIALMFEDDPDEEELLKKQDRVINNTLDTVLRGTGLYGVFLSTAKNVALELYEQQVVKPEKGKRPDNARVLIEALNVSPPIGIKAREFYGAIKGYEFNKDVISEIGLDINNPALDISANVASSLFNIPVNRAINKARNLSAAADSETEAWQKIALILGWNTWDVGLQGEELDKIKKEIREVNKELRKPKKIKRAKR